MGCVEFLVVMMRKEREREVGWLCGGGVDIANFFLLGLVGVCGVLW